MPFCTCNETRESPEFKYISITIVKGLESATRKNQKAIVVEDIHTRA